MLWLAVGSHPGQVKDLLDYVAGLKGGLSTAWIELSPSGGAGCPQGAVGFEGQPLESGCVGNERPQHGPGPGLALAPSLPRPPPGRGTARGELSTLGPRCMPQSKQARNHLRSRCAFPSTNFTAGWTLLVLC